MSFVVPPEWAPHRAMWIGWPSHPELWLDNLEPARAEVASLVRSLAETGRERVNLLVRGEEASKAAHAAMPELANLRIVPGEFGDIWLRDTGPIYLSAQKAAAFRFNGWGGKYDLPGDDTVAGQLGAHDGAQLERHDVVLEGGALEHDGEGTIITTRQCLLNPNRNPGWTEADAEAALARSLGARKVLWLDNGLKNDHTDGHVDNLARFVAPGEVVCPMAWGQEDQNADVYDAAARALAGMTDAAGRTVTLPGIPQKIVSLSPSTTEIAFALGAFAAHDVATVGAAVFGFALGGQLEALLDAFVSFLLGHDAPYLSALAPFISKATPHEK